MENLLRFNFKQRYLVLDTETEGLNLLMSRPWQVSWLIATGKKVESFHDHYVDWPDLKVSKDAAFVTGFDKEDYLRRKEDPYHVFSKLWAEMNRDDTLIVGHNSLKFDVYIINILRQLLGLKSDWGFIDRVIDTNALSVAVKNNLQPQDDLITWQYRLAHNRIKGVKTNMAAMLKHYDIPFDKSKLHDARYDIEKNFELYWAIIQDLEL